MKISTASNIPNKQILLAKVISLGQMKVGEAAQLASVVKSARHIEQKDFDYIAKHYFKVIFLREIDSNYVEVIKISNNGESSLDRFLSNTPVIPLDLDVKFTVNYHIKHIDIVP